MSAYITHYPMLQFLDKDNLPAAGGSLKIYDHNTTNLSTIYTDSSLLVEADNPLTLDEYGSCILYVPFNRGYDALVFDVQGNPIQQISNIGNVDFSALDQLNTIIVEEDDPVNPIRTINLDSITAKASILTTDTNADLTFAPGTGGKVLLPSKLFFTDAFSTNGYSFVAGPHVYPIFD